MGQKKIKRFAEIGHFKNVMEYPREMAGNWRKFFNNSRPVILELACGKGEYTIGLAELYPEKNFIGVDIKGNRIWVGAKSGLEKKLTNAAFLRIQIQKLDEYFQNEEVDEIWITFPDPHLRNSRSKKRLTHPEFLRIYRKVLKQDGLIHLKTDSPDLYKFTKLVISMYRLNCITDINIPGTIPPPEFDIKTHYESLDIAGNKTLYYISFTIPQEIPPLDEALQEELRQAEINALLDSSNDNEDFYLDNGNLVMTEHYHLKRGYCCGNGCRHCPFSYEKVPEPRRSKLLTSRSHA